MKLKAPKWTMPKWMEQYRAMIVNTGGNDVQEMVNGDADPFINLPLSTLQACVKSQVHLLEKLNEAGLLVPPRVNAVIEQRVWKEIARVMRQYAGHQRLTGTSLRAAREILAAVLREVRQ